MSASGNTHCYLCDVTMTVPCDIRDDVGVILFKEDLVQICITMKSHC